VRRARSCIWWIAKCNLKPSFITTLCRFTDQDMRKIIKQSLLISVLYSFLVSILFYTFSIQFYAVNPGEDTELVYRGLDAVRFMIKEFGIIHYLTNALPHYLFFGLSIFITLFIQGSINAKKRVHKKA
jgi:uncharacterized membrane protein SpoIIM required for sporulation